MSGRKEEKEKQSAKRWCLPPGQGRTTWNDTHEYCRAETGVSSGSALALPLWSLPPEDPGSGWDVRDSLVERRTAAVGVTTEGSLVDADEVLFRWLFLVVRILVVAGVLEAVGAGTTRGVWATSDVR